MGPRAGTICKCTCTVGSIIVSKMTSHCAGTVQMRKESESGIRKREEDDSKRGGQLWRAMEDCSTDERLQQETLCRRQWTDEYVKRPETLMRQNVVVVQIQCLLVDAVRHASTLLAWGCSSRHEPPQYFACKTTKIIASCFTYTIVSHNEFHYARFQAVAVLGWGQGAQAPQIFDWFQRCIGGI